MRMPAERGPEAPGRAQEPDASCARCVLARNPNPMTGPGTNTWILGRRDQRACVVVDPGPDDPVHVEGVMERCRAGGWRVVAVMLTHGHADHGGGARRLSALSGAPVLSREANTLPDRPLAVTGLGFEVVVISLPGHSSDSVGFYVAEDALVLTGDMIFATRPTMIAWPDGMLSSYLQSLSVLEELVKRDGVSRLLPGHGPLIDDPLACIARCRKHRLQRLRQVVDAVERGVPARAEELLSAVYRDIDPRLRDAAARNVHAQLRYAFDAGLLPGRREE